MCFAAKHNAVETRNGISAKNILYERISLGIIEL